MARPRKRPAPDRLPLVAVLGGAGAMGRAVVYDLALAGHSARILDRDRAAARRVARRYGNAACSVQEADAADPAALARALAGAGVLVNCAPYRMNLAAMD